MPAAKLNDVVRGGIQYLLARVEDGLCLEFHQLRHGPSMAWTTSCVGSTLAEFQATPKEMLGAVLSLQWESGGWSYNQNSVPDADSTLRALQFLAKMGFSDKVLVSKAEQFVLDHQQADGGITTYLPDAVAAMGYPEGGWTTSHPCVTALAVHVLRDSPEREKARAYLAERLDRGDARAYWWRTPWYVRYESSRLNGESISDDPVEIALALLLRAKLGLTDSVTLTRLTDLQLEDGSFPSSQQFRIPRPDQLIDAINERTELVEDRLRVFSTAAAIVAIHRHGALHN